MFTKKPIVLIFICFIAIFFIGKFANAFPIEYRVDYDPIQGDTTLFNSDSSSADLMFWITTGPYQGSIFWLSPSSTVTIDQTGNIIGSYMLFGTACKNEKHANKNWTITNMDIDNNDVIITDLTDSTTHILKDLGDQYTVPKCHKFKVSGGKWRGGGCQIDSLLDNTSAFFYSDSWLGISDQERVELLNGSVWSIDDTDEFISIFTPIVSTGCFVPEPSTIILLGLGMGGIFYIGKKRWSLKI